MGALLSCWFGIDQTTQYGFKFSGITLWLLVADDGVQQVIDKFNSNCPRWVAHSTLQYGMRLDEADARNRFARLRGAVEGSGPITLRAMGPPHLYGPSGDVPPYQMRGLGIMYSGAPAYDDRRAHLAASFDESGSSFPHTSLVYDWIGSPRVTGAVADAIRAENPQLARGAEVVFDGVALVDMRGKDVGAWEILDRISLAPGCDINAIEE